jgi:hypothetical protein
MSTKHSTDRAATAAGTANGSTVVSDPSHFGLIGYTVTLKVTDEQKDKLAALGALHIAQRGPASRVEKTLAGYKKSRTEMGSDWTRKSIGYSKEIEAQFASEMTKEFTKDCADPDNAPLLGVEVSVQTSEYKPEARPVAYAEAKKIISNAIASKALSKLVKNVGFKGTVTAETVEKNTEFLQAVEADRKRRNEAMFA